MLPVYSAKLMKAWDQYTMDCADITSLELMERAADRFVIWFAASFSKEFSILILCGNGNNGGDGLAIARKLKRLGYLTSVVLIPVGSQNSHDYNKNLERINAIQLKVINSQEEVTQCLSGSKNWILIDAVLGYGMNRIPDLDLQTWFRFMNSSGCPIVSVDLPSGMFVDSPTETDFVHAQNTFTFQSPKLCHLLPDTGKYCGSLTVGSIDLDQGFIQSHKPSLNYLEDKDLKKIYKPRNPFDWKNKFGHLLMVGGSRSMSGAIILSATAGLRSGCGLCSIYTEDSNIDLIHLAIPEAIIVLKNEIDITKYNCIVIGPGMGRSIDFKDVLRELLLQYKGTMVIDADALNMIAEEKWQNQLNNHCIITPHIGEFERLFGKSKDGFERLERARSICSELKIYMILKGKYSAIINPEREVFFNHTGNPGMAKGGSGDVLSGMLGAILSQGYSTSDACILSTGLHGMAADIARENTEEESMIASDIILQISNAFHRIRS